jgi:hypothetical protein
MEHSIAIPILRKAKAKSQRGWMNAFDPGVFAILSDPELRKRKFATRVIRTKTNIPIFLNHHSPNWRFTPE